MTTPVYPSSLPAVSSLRWAPNSQLAITNNEVGPKAYRRYTQVPSADATITWRFIEGDFAIFQAFYKTTLLRGHRWFSIKLPCGGGYVYHTVRIARHRSAKHEGFTHWDVTAEVFVRERKLRPDIIFTYITSTPYPIYALESMDVGCVVVAGSLSSLVGYADDHMDISLAPLSGELRDAVKFGYGDDAMDITFEPTAGSLVDVLLTYDMGNEQLEISLAPVSGILRAALVQNVIPAESIDTTFTVLSGSLETP